MEGEHSPALAFHNNGDARREVSPRLGGGET